MRQILAFGRLMLHNHRFDRQLYVYRPAATDFYCAVKKQEKVSNRFIIMIIIESML